MPIITQHGYIGDFSSTTDLSTRYPAALWAGREANVSTSTVTTRYISDGVSWKAMILYDPATQYLSTAGGSTTPLIQYPIEAQFTDTTTQVGQLDSPVSIKFGSAGSSTNNLLSIDANGIITALKTGPFFGKTRIRAQRTGAAGTSVLIFYTQISTDGGTNWSVLGNAGTITLENSHETDVFFDMSPITVTTGLKIRQMFSRTSSGTDYGDLVPYTPPAPLIALGVPTVPSAQLTIYRLANYNYV